MKHNRAWQKEWREKRKAAEPPKPLTRNAIVKKRQGGSPLTPEEQEIYDVWRLKRTDQHRVRRHREKAETAIPNEAPPTEDIARGVFVPVSNVSKAEPRIAANR